MRRNTFEFVRFPFEEREPARRKITSTQRQTRNREAWEALLVVARTLWDSSLSPRAIAIANFLEETIASTRQQLPDLERLRADEFRKKVTQIEWSAEEKKEISVALMAAFLVELERVASTDAEVKVFANSDDELRQEITSYTSWLAISETRDRGLALLADIREIEVVHRTTLTEMQLRLAEFTEHSMEIQERDRVLRNSLTGLETQVGNALNEFRGQISEAAAAVSTVHTNADALHFRVEASHTNIEAFKIAVTEEVRGSETRKLWRDRDAEAWSAFLFSSSLLACLLILIPLVGLWQLDWVIKTLRHIGEATTEGIPSTESGTIMTVATISRLVVVTFPLVLYLWVIRLVVRFNMRSLMLHDDARQRQTMMDTYFILLEREAATPEERGLILNALFRPTPGQGPENVDPPSFADFIGKSNPIK